VLGLCLLGLALATPADAFVYWTNGSSIGRSTLEGGGVNKRWINDIGFADAVAVDRHNIYWTVQGGNAIGRANINGTGIDESFISGDGPVRNVAVDGDHIYWTNAEAKTIGRANLDGTDPDQSLITTLGGPGDLAVDAEHIYWVNHGLGFDFSGAIGRANLDGSDADQGFTYTPTQPTFPDGVAVGAGHLYWADYAFGYIVRADLAGTAELFILDINAIFGAGTPHGVAVDARPFPVVPPDPAPVTTITKRPPNKTRKHRVKFRFVSSEPGSSFRCKLDRRPFEPCESPKKLRRLKKGKHRFKVRAIDAAGNPDPTPAKDRFKVLR